MLMDITEIVGLEVYTEKAILVGTVKDVILNTEDHDVDSIYIEHPNPLVIQGGINVAIPFRWIYSIGDIIVLRYFPRYVKTSAATEEKAPNREALVEEVE